MTLAEIIEGLQILQNSSTKDPNETYIRADEDEIWAGHDSDPSEADVIRLRELGWCEYGGHWNAST